MTAAGPTPVWITGYGAISCVAADAAGTWLAAYEGRSGIREGLGAVALPTESPSVAARLSRLKTTPFGALRGGKALPMAISAIEEALAAAGWEGLRDDDGLLLATTTGQGPLWEDELMRHLLGELPADRRSSALATQPLGVTLAVLRELYGFRGRATILSTACSASTHAIALGHRWVRSGQVRRCLVGGVEVLSRLTVEGFRSLKLLSAERARPFDATRQGINLSESAAFICLERDRAGTAVARVAGSAFSSDAYHMTAPHPEGRGSVAAMRGALSHAGLEPAAVDWIHAHGTGSIHNDLSEGIAVVTVFGDKTPVSSTKAIHGHSLAASGALESVLCLESMRRGVVLGTPGLATPDEKIAVRHATHGAKMPLRCVLKNSLGFGGANGALVFVADGESR